MIKKYGLRVLFLLCLGVVGLGGAALGGPSPCAGSTT